MPSMDDKDMGIISTLVQNFTEQARVPLGGKKRWLGRGGDSGLGDSGGGGGGDSQAHDTMCMQVAARGGGGGGGGGVLIAV